MINAGPSPTATTVRVFGNVDISKTLSVGQTCTCSNVPSPTAAGQPQSRKML